MAPLPKHIGIAMDLHGCPNRCRHCYLGNGPNRRLPVEILREVAEAFRAWRRAGAADPYFEQVDVSSWYREPDFSDDYRSLYDLERDLSGREPRRYELLSTWRLARDPSYAPWAREHGPRICQTTFFGMERLTDEMAGRRGAFKDTIRATERLLEVGMIPRWQIILTKPGLADLSDLVRLAEEMNLAQRVADLDASFDMFCHPPGPHGEAFNLEGVRIEDSDLALIPDELLEATRRHFGGAIDWKPESQSVEEVIDGATVAAYVPDQTWFLVNADVDTFSNYGDMTEGWRLGSFRKDGIDTILEAFESDRPPAMWATFHVPDAELAARFGRRDSRCLYGGGDVKTRWVKLATRARSCLSFPLPQHGEGGRRGLGGN